MTISPSTFPLSDRQQQVWIAQRLHPGLPLFHIVFSFRIRGALDPVRFERALETAVRGTDALRMVVRTDADGQPFIEIRPEVPIDLMYVDKRKDWDPTREGMDTFVNRFIWLPFDLQDRLFQTWLFRTGDEEYLWVLKTHHIISDGISIQHFYDRTAEAFREPGKPVFSPLFAPQMPVPIDGISESYWQNKFSEKMTAFTLFGRTDEGHAHPVERFSWPLPDNLIAAVDALNHRRDKIEAHRFSFFTAALMLFLNRYGDTLTPTVSMVYHGRTSDLARQTFGFFARMLPLQVEIEREDTLQALIEKVRNEVSAARRHSAAVPSNSRQQVFTRASVNLHTAAFPPFCGIPVDVRWHQSGWNENSLVLNIHTFSGAQAELEMVISKTLLDAEGRRDAAERFHRLVSNLLENPEKPAYMAAGLTETEADAVLRAWQGPHLPLPERSLIEIFERLAARLPGHVAFRFRDEALDYRALNARANQLAHRLLQQTADAHTTIGIRIRPGLELPIAVLAVLKSGSAFVMLPPDLPVERLQAILENADVRLVLTNEPLPGNISGIETTDVPAAPLPEPDPGNPGRHMPLDAPLYIAYTSGTTGRPKGVRVPQRQLLQMLAARQQAFPLAPDEVVCHKSDPGFVDSTIELFHGLLHGIPTIILAEETVKDPERFVQALGAHGVTRARFVPEHLKTLIEVVPDIGSRLPALRTLTGTAAEMKPDDLQQFFRAFPGRRFLNTFGLTELLSVAFCELTEEDTSAERLPIGRPIPNRTVYILDRLMQPLPPGIPGDLYAGGEDLPLEYIGMPEENASRFLPDPFLPGRTIFRTGDLARWLPDGRLEHLGRRDHQVKIRGQRVEPGEVEAALSRLPQVRRAAVKAVIAGERTLLAAYLVCETSRPEISGLRRALAGRLPDYMIPSFFVFLEQIPLTASGKVDRQALPDPSPNAGSLGLAAGEVPHPGTEQLLAEIWQDALQIGVIGRNADFLALGGDSLTAALIQNRVEKKLRVRIPLAAFAGVSTIAEQALLVTQKSDPWEQLIPLRAEGTAAPLFLIPPAGATVLTFHNLVRHLPPELPVYGLQPWGTDGENRPHTSIPAMAKAYIREIRTVQPDGPYLLAGMCFGGLVVFEMARQLEAEGLPVAMTAVLDTLLPPNLSLRSRLKGLYVLLKRNLRTGQFLTRVHLARLKAQLSENADIQENDIPRLNRVFQANAISRYFYFARKFNGKIDLLFSRDSSYPRHRKKAWEQLAAAVQIRYLAGDHTGSNSILQEPNVRMLADELTTLIRESLEKPTDQIRPESPGR